MKRWYLVCTANLFAFLLLVSLGGVASAQQPSQDQVNAIRQSCRSDFQSYCSGVPTGGSAALQCLQSHVSQLSPSCQGAVGAVSGSASARPPPASGQAAPPQAPQPAMTKREEIALMRRSCGGDFRAYCRGVPLGGGGAISCLAENQSRLSPACQSALAQAHGTR